ncbi:MAG: ATP-binding protein [Stellaceae bacterium]
MGLPLSKSLVELHGGHFSITSTPGRGTTVTITLPADSGETAADLRGVA